MRKDNFKCVACGRNPATDPKIVLHVDHIIGRVQAELARVSASEIGAPNDIFFIFLYFFVFVKFFI
jgi:hypothetical protein